MEQITISCSKILKEQINESKDEWKKLYYDLKKEFADYRSTTQKEIKDLIYRTHYDPRYEDNKIHLLPDPRDEDYKKPLPL